MSNLSPLLHRFEVFVSNIKVKLGKNFIDEVYVCCVNKLPKEVKVEWKREDDGFIVGKVNVDGYEFTTQGENAKDFIEMVNDAIYAIYEIPPQYISRLGYNKYHPKPEQLEQLKDDSIKQANFGSYYNQECSTI